MIRNAVAVHCPLADGIAAGRQHLVFKRTRVIRRDFRLGEARERDRDAFFHKLRCLFSLGGGDEVQRAELVVLAPAALVGKLFDESFDVGRRHFVFVMRSGRVIARKRDG